MIEDVLRHVEERGVCHSCLAAAVGASFDEVHTAIRLLRRQPYITVDIGRCRACQADRVTVRVSVVRDVRRDTPEPMTA